MAAGTGDQGAFALGAGCPAIGFAGLRLHSARRARQARVDDAGALAAEHPGP